MQELHNLVTDRNLVPIYAPLNNTKVTKISKPLTAADNSINNR